MPSKGTIRIDGAAGDRAAEDQRHGVPGAEPAAVAHHARQRAAAAGDRRAVPLATSRRKREEYADKARDAAAERRPRRLRRPVSVAALRRHAAARQHLPRAGARAEDAAARRAVRRARRVHARGAVVHAARPAGGAAVQRHPGHARPARERVPGRHGLRDEQEPGPLRRASARSTCRGRAISRSPTRRSSPTSCTSCAATSARCAQAGASGRRAAQITKQRRALVAADRAGRGAACCGS